MLTLELYTDFIPDSIIESGVFEIKKFILKNKMPNKIINNAITKNSAYFFIYKYPFFIKEKIP